MGGGDDAVDKTHACGVRDPGLTRVIQLFTVFICLVGVVVGFDYFAVVGCKDL